MLDWNFDTSFGSQSGTSGPYGAYEGRSGYGGTSGGSGGDGGGGYLPVGATSPRPPAASPFGDPQFSERATLGAPGGAFSGLFDDPTFGPLIDALNRRQGQLNEPVTYGGEYESLLRGAIPSLMSRSQQTDPTVAKVIKALVARMGAGSPDNGQMGQFVSRSNSRIEELRGDPFSDADEAAMRVQYFDEDERDRTVAKQQVLERMGSMGHAPSSGPVAEALLQVDRAFDQRRAGKQNSLMTYQIDERQRRRSEAQSLSQQLAEMGAQQQGAEMSWQNQGFQFGATGAGLAQQQQQMGLESLLQALQAGGALSGLQQSRYSDTQRQGAESVALGGIPIELANGQMDRYLQMLMMTMGEDPLGALLQSSGQQQGQYNINQQSNAALTAAIGNALGAYYGRDKK